MYYEHFCFFALKSWLVLAHSFRGHREGQEDWTNCRLAENQIRPKTWLAAKLYQKKRHPWHSPARANPQVVGAKGCVCLHSIAVLQRGCCWTSSYCTWVWEANRVLGKWLPKENSGFLIYIYIYIHTRSKMKGTHIRKSKVVSLWDIWI